MDNPLMPLAPMLLRLEILAFLLLVAMIYQLVLLTRILKAHRDQVRIAKAQLELWEGRFRTLQPVNRQRSA